MKKLILSLALVVNSIILFASEETISSVVLKSFQKEFANAQNVSWTLGKSSYKASFELNKQTVVAYYNFNGELIGLTRNISSLDLPLNLQNNLKKSFKGYWITDLFEVSNDAGTNYYITVEKADEILILESVASGPWSEYKRISKS